MNNIPNLGEYGYVASPKINPAFLLYGGLVIIALILFFIFKEEINNAIRGFIISVNQKKQSAIEPRHT